MKTINGICMIGYNELVKVNSALVSVETLVKLNIPFNIEVLPNSNYFMSNDYNLLTPIPHNRYCGAPNMKAKTETEVKNFNKHQNTISGYFADFGEMIHKHDSSANPNCLPMFDPRRAIEVAYIDGKYYMVDGNCRMSFCRKNNIPFYYRINPMIVGMSAGTDYNRRLNNEVNLPWTITDNIYSDAERPDSDKVHKEICKKIIYYTQSSPIRIGISEFVYFAVGKDAHKKSVVSKGYKFFNEEKAIKMLDWLYAFGAVSGYMELARRKTLVNAMTSFYEKVNGDNNKFLRMLRNLDIDKKPLNCKEYKQKFQDAYNKGLHRTENKIELVK
jgi:hypothetical protein